MADHTAIKVVARVAYRAALAAGATRQEAIQSVLSFIAQTYHLSPHETTELWLVEGIYKIAEPSNDHV